MRRALFLFCAVMACEATGFEPEYLVDTLRVLAVRADSPFATPGQTVHFSTLWADPGGAGRAVQWAWGTCLNPSSTQINDCANQLRTLGPGTDSFSATVPQEALDGVPVGEFGVVFAACAGTIRLVQNPASGAPVTCVDASGNPVGRDGFIWGGTRVTVVNGITNTNPAIDQVLIDGAPWAPGDVPVIEACAQKHVEDCPPSSQHVFSFTATPESIETYDIGQGPTQEQLVGWFYVTQGSLTAGYASPDADVSPPTFEMEFTPTLTDPSKTLRVYMVLRDDRGGLSFTERQLAWK